MSDCKEAKANKPSGSLSSTKLTHRLQKLHTPSNKMMPERPAGNSKPGGMGPERGPVTANNGVVVRRARCGTAAMKVTARARASIFALLAARKTHGRLAGHASSATNNTFTREAVHVSGKVWEMATLKSLHMYEPRHVHVSEGV